MNLHGLLVCMTQCKPFQRQMAADLEKELILRRLMKWLAIKHLMHQPNLLLGRCSS
jgi:hypothetical protein